MLSLPPQSMKTVPNELLHGGAWQSPPNGGSSGCATEFAPRISLTLSRSAVPMSCRTAPDLRVSWVMTTGVLDEEK
jgi:hypothetical protein